MKIYDLSHIIENNMTSYSKEELPNISKLFTIKNNNFNVTEIKLTSHLGTHVDVPYHIIQTGKNILDFNLDNFAGKGICVNFDNLKNFDFEKNKDIEFILIYTGWDKYWNSEKYFKNYPVLNETIINKIISSNLKGIGFDCISPDSYSSTELTVHENLLKNNKIIIENLCNLNQVLNKTFIFTCFPLKIKSDGCPVRATAIEI